MPSFSIIYSLSWRLWDCTPWAHRAPPSLARVPAAGRRAGRQAGCRTADTVPPGRPGPGDRQRTTACAPDGGVGGAASVPVPLLLTIQYLAYLEGTDRRMICYVL